MILEMRQLGLDYLYSKLNGSGDAEEWYRDLRGNNIEALFPYLVEPAKDSMASNYYVIFLDGNNNEIAVLEQRVFKEGDSEKLPFVQSTGSQSPALGPVIKRSFSKEKGGGPTVKILDTTLKAFAEIGREGQLWSDYFSYIHELLSSKSLWFDGKTFDDCRSALHKAIEVISETKTAYLSILDREGRLPGERKDYRAYLQYILATEKYSTQKITPEEDKEDSLTGERTRVYPNSLAGSGLNLTNVDRAGVFSNLLEENAWKKFSLSAPNADLLFVFKFHMLNDFIGRIAGEQALVLPQLVFEQHKRQKFVSEFKKYVENVNSQGVDIGEKRLLRHFKDHPDAIVSITIVWADFGQKLENVSGIISDILPSRLTTIAKNIDELKDIQSPIFPVYNIENVEPDLALNSLASLLKRPGGKKNQKANNSTRLFEFKRDTAARIYHGREIAMNRFWDEFLDVAREYLLDAAQTGNFYGLINEGIGKKGTFLTFAGWMKHLAKYIYFFTQLEVYKTMTNWTYTPRHEKLKTFFANTDRTAGLNSQEKVYAFLLGVLFGKVMEVQGARGVNVGANALTWLRRLNITGEDLPSLYNKIREKLLTYETDSRPEVSVIIEEVGHLGIQIGVPRLNKTDACYYLLLGQSLMKTLIPPKDKNKKQEGGEDNE
jgi:CRISPR-associated protein Csh1